MIVSGSVLDQPRDAYIYIYSITYHVRGQTCVLDHRQNQESHETPSVFFLFYVVLKVSQGIVQ